MCMYMSFQRVERKGWQAEKAGGDGWPGGEPDHDIRHPISGVSRQLAGCRLYYIRMDPTKRAKGLGSRIPQGSPGD